MLTRSLVRPLEWIRDRAAALLARFGVPPNVLTWACLVLNFWAGLLFAAGFFASAGITMLAAGFFDLVDGPVARLENRVTKFGGFLDSILDRYADLVLFVGLLVYYTRVNRFFYAILVGIAMAGSVMVSYAEARAESLIPSCRVGFWERPERVALMIFGALVNRMPLVLWLLAVGPNITVVHRIVYTWKQTERRSTVPAAVEAKSESAPVSAAPNLRHRTASGA